MMSLRVGPGIRTAGAPRWVAWTLRVRYHSMPKVVFSSAKRSFRFPEDLRWRLKESRKLEKLTWALLYPLLAPKTLYWH